MAPKTSIKRISTAPAGGTASPRKKTTRKTAPPTNPGRRSAVSAQKRAEKGWRGSEKAFQNAFEKSVIGKSLTRPDGSVRVNKAMADMLGYSIKALEGRNWRDITHPDDIDTTQKNVDALLSGKAESVRFTKRFIHKDGYAVWVDLGSTLRRDENGRPLYLITDLIDISERKHAEEILRASEATFAALFQANASALALTGIEDGRILDVNENWLALMGFRREEVLGKTAAEYGGWKNSAAREDMRRKLAATGSVRNHEAVCVRKGGEEITILFSAQIVEIEGERILLSSAVDITERKRAEAALAAERNILRTLIDYLPDNVFIKDPQGLIILNNLTHRRFLGRQGLDDVVGKSDRDFFEPALADRYMEDERRIVESGRPLIDYEEPTVDREGRLHWYLTTKVPVRDSRGKITALVGINHDITERKQVEQALKENEERLRDILFSTADWVWEVDENGVYTYSSQKGFDLFGSPPESVIGKTPFDFMPPDEARRIAAIFAEIAAHKAPIKDLENWNITKTGEKICILTNGVPILDGQGNLKGYRGVDKDITEHKKAEEQIRRSLQEKEILLREIYHRTKNNMNVISAMLSLRGESCGDEATTRTLRDIEDRIKAMALVHQKLYESPDLSRIDMRDYLIDLTSLLMKTSRPPDGLFRLECEAEPLRVPVDMAIPLGMIVTELFSNVFKHALPENGEVGVRLHLVQSGTGEIELTLSDDGIGVPPGFDFRASQTLGLQTVFMLVEHQLQGRVDFQSGRGVTCRIRIPAPDLPVEART